MPELYVMSLSAAMCMKGASLPFAGRPVLELGVVFDMSLSCASFADCSDAEGASGTWYHDS